MEHWMEYLIARYEAMRYYMKDIAKEMAGMKKTTTALEWDASFKVECDEIAPLLTFDIQLYQFQKISPAVAMFDTGAGYSCVTKKFAQSFGLVSNGEMNVKGAVGEERRPRYNVNLILPAGISFDLVPVAEVDFTDCDFDILLGMDIISQGNLNIRNDDGKTVFTFSRRCGTNKGDKEYAGKERIQS